MTMGEVLLASAMGFMIVFLVLIFLVLTLVVILLTKRKPKGKE